MKNNKQSVYSNALIERLKRHFKEDPDDDRVQNLKLTLLYYLARCASDPKIIDTDPEFYLAANKILEVNVEN